MGLKRDPPPPTKSRLRRISDRNRRRIIVYECRIRIRKIHSYTKYWISYTINRPIFTISRRIIVYDGRDDISYIRNIVSQDFVLRNFPSYTKSNLGSEFVYEITFWIRNSCEIRLKSISAIDDNSSPFWSGGAGFRLKMMIWIRIIV